MKVMMVQLPHFYGSNSRFPTSYPLGIGYLASVLKNIHEMIPMDLWIDNLKIDEAITLIKKKPSDVFCISVYSTQYPYFKELVKTLKDIYPEIKIIAGGPGATFSYNVFLEKTLVDICVIGEGEITLKELLDNLNTPEDVPGVAYRLDGKVILNQSRQQIKDLDSIPLPDRDFFDIERYITAHKKIESPFNGLRCTNTITGRGCPYRCTFCSKTFSGYRMRSIDKVNDEIQLLKESYNIQALEFDDELVLVNKKRSIDLSSVIKKYHLLWGCQGRINHVDEEILRNMKSAGCRYIGYGVESYSQNILNRMKKKIKTEQIIPTIEMTQRIGIKPLVQYMYGYLGENDKTIEQTYTFFKKIDQPYSASITTPLPGSPLYQDVIERNLISDEEGYLMRLTGGYNVSVPLINLTDFTDEEFFSKKIALQKKINTAYYLRHPYDFLKKLQNQIFRFGSLLITNPRLFLKKVFMKLGQNHLIHIKNNGI
jgi:radical SAM superfamily enzyme YgiQ (UPF0313 family)